MNILDKKSLFHTIDNVSEALFFGLEIDQKEKEQITHFILNQQGKPGTYADTFAPTEHDLTHDLVLFTGEKIKTNAGRSHIIGEEASRILRLIGTEKENTEQALGKADNGLLKIINSGKNDPRYIYGTYCCKTCSCALWLNISSGGIINDIPMLAAGIKYLRTTRDGNGSWKGFPSNYILYVLNEIETNLVINELKYAGNAIERKLKRKKITESKYELRRATIYERILTKINSN